MQFTAKRVRLRGGEGWALWGTRILEERIAVEHIEVTVIIDVYKRGAAVAAHTGEAEGVALRSGEVRIRFDKENLSSFSFKPPQTHWVEKTQPELATLRRLVRRQ